MEDDLTQIHMCSGHVWIVEGDVTEIAVRWRDNPTAILELTNKPAQTIFPPGPLFLKSEEIAGMVKQSAEAWTFQRQIEEQRWAEAAGGGEE